LRHVKRSCHRALLHFLLWRYTSLSFIHYSYYAKRQHHIHTTTKQWTGRSSSREGQVWRNYVCCTTCFLFLSA